MFTKVYYIILVLLGIVWYILEKLNVIPINREKPDISTIKNILKAIKDGYALGIFPDVVTSGISNYVGGLLPWDFTIRYLM